MKETGDAALAERQQRRTAHKRHGPCWELSCYSDTPEPWSQTGQLVSQGGLPGTLVYWPSKFSVSTDSTGHTSIERTGRTEQRLLRYKVTLPHLIETANSSRALELGVLQ